MVSIDSRILFKHVIDTVQGIEQDEMFNKCCHACRRVPELEIMYSDATLDLENQFNVIKIAF